MTCCAKRRDIFLKIEPVSAYSPLSPEPCARRWGRDEMFNMGHELGRVQASEIVATTLDASGSTARILVYTRRTRPRSSGRTSSDR